MNIKAAPRTGQWHRTKTTAYIIANNEGLLVYDGTNWQTYPVSNKTIVRSIGFGAEGKLYAGAQDETGYFSTDKAGKLQFKSLKYLLTGNKKNFTDVWELEAAGNEVFFRTNTRIFKPAGEKFASCPAQSAWPQQIAEGNYFEFHQGLKWYWLHQGYWR